MTRPDVLRWIDSGALEPTLNMGIDEALLRADGPPTLRLYGWSPPGLSLGYFQHSSDFSDVEGPHVLVRRLTGGGAIYHDREITFALTADLDLLPTDVQASYDLVHRAIAAALSAHGIPTSRSEGTPQRHGARPESSWCMADPGPGDLVTRPDHKIVGSAQRRIRTPVPRVLHHGSIVLTPPTPTPDCGAVAEHAPPGDVAASLRQAVVTELAAALDLRPEERPLTDAELRCAREFATTRYGDPRFTHRR